MEFLNLPMDLDEEDSLMVGERELAEIIPVLTPEDQKIPKTIDDLLSHELVIQFSSIFPGSKNTD